MEFASWSLLLYVLIVMFVNGSGAREIAGKKWEELEDHNLESKQEKLHDFKSNIVQPKSPVDDENGHSKEIIVSGLKHPLDDDLPNLDNVLRTMDDQDSTHQDIHKMNHHGHGLSHMDHMDLSLMVFFTMKDLKVGKRIPIYFPKKNPSASPHFLPREEADSIPFSLKELPFLLKFFSFSQESPQAKAMEDTLTQCETEPIKGETKFCATSLESMLDFAQGIFGTESNFNVLTTTHLTNSSTLFQNYTILEVPKEKSPPKMVACHTMPYPFAVFYCHSQQSENKVFKVSLGGDNGDRVDAVAVCHMDTSQWSRNHVSFRVLGIEPGSSHVCHFFPADNLVMVPALPILISNVFVM